ncbi:MAG: metal-dependent hydrolase [Candidatus Cloacimonetes bacterium]|nr:metal-dependent hydrolase [Candidatus Cloacimonadota bacterium]
MPLAVTHILIPIILIDIFRDHVLKKKGVITNKHVLLAGLAGLFPDIDLPIGYFLMGGVNVHRLYTHNIWLPILFLAFSMFFHSIKKKKISLYFVMIAFGFLVHLILDASLSGFICPFYPFSSYAFGLNLISRFFVTFLPSLAHEDFGLLIFSSMDAVLLFFWLIYLQLKGKIKDYF